MADNSGDSNPITNNHTNNANPDVNANSNSPSSGDRQTHLTVHDVPPPPYTETDIYSASSRDARSPHDDAASTASTTDNIIYTPPLTPRSSPPASPSAAHYFDQRPAPIAGSEPTLLHSVTVSATTTPDDLPYKNEWATRDVSEQDWATFVNFLIPSHAALKNEEVRGRKLGDGSAAASEKNDGHADEKGERKREAEATMRQWNDGFFAPRGMRIQVNHEPVPDADEARNMPGAWDTAFDGSSAPPPAVPPRQTGGVGGWRGSFGGIRIDDGVRFGEGFVADSNGLRIGSLVMDSNGVRMGGQNRNPSRGRGAGRGPCRGPGRGGWRQYQSQFQPFVPSPPHYADRGRPLEPHGPHHDKASRSSSVSSTGSSDSSSSTSSVGSLPDYDDLKPQQLPLYINRLQSWTAQPDHIRTRADVKQLRQELKASKDQQPGQTQEKNQVQDKAALRAQIKALTQQWKQIKKQQRREVRQQKRERKQRRKAEKRERRQQRKEMKRSRKEHRKERGEGRRGCGGGGGGGWAPPPPPPPGMQPTYFPGMQVPPVHVPAINLPAINVPGVHVPPVHVPAVHVPGVNVPPVFGMGPCGGGGWFGQGATDSGSSRSPSGGWHSWARAPRSPPSQVPTGNGYGGERGQFPGAWPEDRKDNKFEDDNNKFAAPTTTKPDAKPPATTARPASKSMYNHIDELESELDLKKSELETFKGSEEERLRRERNKEDLAAQLNFLRLEADEEFARELAAELSVTTLETDEAYAKMLAEERD